LRKISKETSPSTPLVEKGGDFTKFAYQRPAWAEVDLQAIKHNVNVARSFLAPNVEIMAIVKADAYGHGAVPVSKTLVEAGVERLGVALIEEARELKQAGINLPTHVLTEVPPEAVKELVASDFIATVCSKAAAEVISAEAVAQEKKAKVHVKVDTGMNRIGIAPDQVLDFVEYLWDLQNIDVEGIFTHFARADEPGCAATKEQILLFKRIIADLETSGFEIPIKHAANSAATFLLPESHFDMVRLGISLYGLHPSAATLKKVDLKPALSLKAQVSFVKNLPAGVGVSYGHLYKTRQPTVIATLPIGYGDGYTRLLSNKSQVIIKGKKYPVVGAICMDQLMVDVGLDSAVNVNDEAILIGREGDLEISADELADLLGTINYEIVCMIGKRVPRLYKGG
jgi:alanine racemase